MSIFASYYYITSTSSGICMFVISANTTVKYTCTNSLIISIRRCLWQTKNIMNEFYIKNIAWYVLKRAEFFLSICKGRRMLISVCSVCIKRNMTIFIQCSLDYTWHVIKYSIIHYVIIRDKSNQTQGQAVVSLSKKKLTLMLSTGWYQERIQDCFCMLTAFCTVELN